MSRFRIDPQHIRDGKIWLDFKESHHAIVVLRLKTGDAVDLIDGKGHSFKGVVDGCRDDRLNIRIVSLPDTPAVSDGISYEPQITLAVSVIKPERMELLIQKACELGVHSIIPVRSERSIVKLSKERWQKKVKRWQKIAAESCKQCGLALIPQVAEVVDFKSVFVHAKNFDRFLIPTLAATTTPLYDTLKQLAPRRLLVLIGPEGDFTKKETDLAVSFGAAPVSLGPLVLRTETAAMYILSVLNFFYREIDQKRGDA